MKRGLLFQIFLMLALFWMCTASCNLLVIIDRKQEKRFEKCAIPLYTFRDQSAIRSVHASSAGKPLLMLVHGYGASGIGQYYKLAQDLVKDYDLILPDLLYCGKSRGLQNQYSIDDQVEHLRILLDSLGIDRPFTLVGNSYGGIVSAGFAERYPDRVNKLVIYDSPVNAYSLAYADSLASSLGLPSVKEILSPVTIHQTRISLDMIFYDQPYIPRFLRMQMVKYGTRPSRVFQLPMIDHLIANEAAYNNHHYSWKMPVYLCWGDSDLLIPMSTCKAIQARYQIPDERLHVFPRAAHAANVEYPEEFAEYIRGVMTGK